MSMVRFLESSAGRVLRSVAGLTMIGVGVGLSIGHAGPWWVLAAAGTVPLFAGLAGACLLGPLLHEPLVPGRGHAA